MAKIVKGELRNRPGKWIVDYRDGAGRRRWITRDTLEQAKKELGHVLSEGGQRVVCALDPNITVAEYCDHYVGSWLQWIKKAKTRHYYTDTLNKRLKPALGRLRLRDVTSARAVSFLGSLRRADGSKLKDSSVLYYYRVARLVFARAVRDGVISVNPFSSLGRELRLDRSTRQVQEEIKSFTPEERSRFLNVCKNERPDWYPLFTVMASTGCRVGEAIGLHVDDFDLEHGRLRVAGTVYANVKDLPKSGSGRTVDLSAHCIEVVRRHLAKVKQDALRLGVPARQVFTARGDAGKYLHVSTVGHAFGCVLKRAGLASTFSPHCLRHTYATLLLTDGVPPQYVQQQLGHSSINITIDTYGKWIPQPGNGAVDRLDAGAGKLEVAR